jgi:predicted metalloprotease
MGGDPTTILLNGLNTPQSVQLTSQQESEQTDFVASVLGNTEDVWTRQFQSIGKIYEQPKLVLFTGAVDSACGYTGSAVGPFYCPLDRKAYLDLGFFQQLETQLNAPGDFARAYVIAHEIGHHIQRLLGTEEKVRQEMANASKAKANALSVQLELQADCYAGVWAHDAKNDYDLLEEGDIEEALNAASKIGDDALQIEAQGYAVPDSFTHGSSAQRYEWFNKGFANGAMQACNTFE